MSTTPPDVTSFTLDQCRGMAADAREKRDSGSPVQMAEFDPERIEWLISQVEANRRAPTVIDDAAVERAVSVFRNTRSKRIAFHEDSSEEADEFAMRAAIKAMEEGK